jgi:hypothetical protein
MCSATNTFIGDTCWNSFTNLFLNIYPIRPAKEAERAKYNEKEIYKRGMFIVEGSVWIKWRVYCMYETFLVNGLVVSWQSS